MESWPAKKNMDSTVYKFSWLFFARYGTGMELNPRSLIEINIVTEGKERPANARLTSYD
jgi:hypothetical protein